MKNPIVLVYPETDKSSPYGFDKPYLPPLGMCFLAAYLSKHGHTVRVIDNTIQKRSHEDVVRDIKTLNPSLVGIQCLSVGYQPCLNLASKIKTEMDVPIVVGGPHATVMPETLQKPLIDFICIGEGENTLLELADSEANRTPIKGLWTRQGEDWSWGGTREWIKDLGSLPHPARDSLSLGMYPLEVAEVGVKPVLAVNSSRGCPFTCKFCSVENVWGRQYRVFPAEWVLEEIRIVTEEYHARGVYFYEDNFTAVPRRVTDICNGILQCGYDVKWACEGRVGGGLTREHMKLMKQAGCRTIKYGVESGSQRVLNLMDKRFQIEQVLETRLDCRAAGLNFACFILIGFPGETDEDRQLTVDFVRRLNPDFLVLNRFIPVPNSWAYQEMLNEGMYGHKDANYMLHPKPEEKAHLMGWVDRIHRAWRS